MPPPCEHAAVRVTLGGGRFGETTLLYGSEPNVAAENLYNCLMETLPYLKGR
jgi:hypothetical protein